jgi:hypothetical protein
MIISGYRNGVSVPEEEFRPYLEIDFVHFKINWKEKLPFI